LELITEQKGILGKNKPFIEKGLCLLPVEQEETWSAKFLRTEDGGASWEVCGDLGPESGARVIQPSLVKLRDGRIMAYMRSQENFVYSSYSKDLGKTWSRAMPTVIPNNNSGIDMVRLESGRIVLVFNPTAIDSKPEKKDPGLPDRLPTGFHTWGARTPLVAALSENDGESWDHVITLEDEAGAFSYPAAIQTRDGSIHITYTYNRKKIKHAVLTEEELLRSEDGKKYSWCKARSSVKG
jgi:predicted neuraminidase